MSTKHIKLKHKVQSIGSKIEFDTLLENSMLSEKEKQIMNMIYKEQKTIGFIADELGYSPITIKKLHKKALNKIERLL